MNNIIFSDAERKKIVEILKELARKFENNFDIRLIYIFGSFNSERMVPQSDLDIAILFGEGHDSYTLFRFAELFKLELLPKIQRKIDITILNLANPLLKYEVLKGGRIVFSKNEELSFKFERRAYQEYEDYCYLQKYYYERFEEELFKA